MQSQISFKEKTGKEIHDSSRLEFLEKFLGNYFALSDADLPLLNDALIVKVK